MLDRQLEMFLGGERLADMTLGLAAACERVAALVTHERRDRAAPREELLADAILGILSLRRQLWASLAIGPDQPPSDTAAETSASPSGRLLR